MAIVCDLAMTAAEFQQNGNEVSHPAWMACHFSPYGLALSNCPQRLPKDTTLIVNDRTPAHGHDPRRILRQLEEIIDSLECGRVLLDFQRPDMPENAAIAKAVAEGLHCPVGVSEKYADDLLCPVFLAPPPLHIPLQEHMAPWAGREIWLEAALDGETITITEDGAAFSPLPPEETPERGFVDEVLCCHYGISIRNDAIRFTLYRTLDDLSRLLQSAQTQGVTRAIGLYQELGIG